MFGPPVIPLMAQQMPNMDIGISVASTMSLLQHLENQELQELLNEDTKLDPTLRDTLHVKSIEADKDMLLATNKSLAETNLSYEPRLAATKQRLIEHYELASELSNRVQEKQRQIEETGKNVNMETAIVLVQTAASRTEEETEAIADRFLEGSVDVELFIETFTAERKVAHLRRVKADKLQEIAKQRGKASRQAPPRPAANPMSPNLPLPYPISSPSLAPYPMYPRLE